jgi:peroxiredoxin
MKSSAATSSRIAIPQLLAVGDIAPNCSLPDQSGNYVNLLSDSIAGNPIVVIFCPRPSAAGQETLECFSRRLEDFTAHGARVFAISPNAIPSPALNFPVLLDSKQQVFAGFTAPSDRPSTVVLRRNYHVAGILNGAAEAQAAAALSLLEGMAPERQSIAMPMHPPVLLIPDALSRDDCARLIEIFETTGQAFVEKKPGEKFEIRDFLNGSDYKMRVADYAREDRIDHFFFKKGTLSFLNNRLNRVMPEIVKAFQYRITKCETLRVARYQGDRGGYSHGHRDNHPPTPYRRFAMSINLNTEDFTGGELRFPEFGDQRYRPESGTAIVFSSSLLHEALHVTSGRRYVLLAFLFGET